MVMTWTPSAPSSTDPGYSVPPTSVSPQKSLTSWSAPNGPPLVIFALTVRLAPPSTTCGSPSASVLVAVTVNAHSRSTVDAVTLVGSPLPNPFTPRTWKS